MNRKRLNITDQIFGRLQAIVIDWYRTNQGKGTYWFCQCECGNIVSVYIGSLRNGSTKSCGCLNREKVLERKLDITDQIFGRLQAIVTDWYKTKQTGFTHWFCQCEDNNIVSVYIGSLRSGNTESCGCLQKEKASENMSKISKKYSGENSFNWKNGITPFYTKIRNSIKYKEFVQTCLKKSNYICLVSKEKGGNLSIHHIKSFAKILEENNITTKEEALECKELWDEKNVIVLSEKWHLGEKTDNPLAFHRLYGKHSFTEEDFYKWFEKFSIIEN